MSRSSDAGHFFQTTSALNETARKDLKSKNTSGDPIKLTSKILAVALDPHNEGQFYVAEAAGTVKRINVKGRKISASYTGPTAPLTSLAISTTSNTLFAGCWDKTIWSWAIATRKPIRQFKGHTDFLKAVLVFTLEGKEVLVSASADASIIVWDVATGETLHTLKGHTRGVLALTLDLTERDVKKDSVVIFSAGSDREIRRWSIGISSAFEIDATSDVASPIIAHETSVDSLRFDSDGDLWTASADKSVKCLSRNRNWEEDTKLEHPDFVRDVVVEEDGGWVVTACRDEEVRVWDKASGKLHHVFSGHFEEVIGLLLLPGQTVVSVSIDGTVRQWSLKAPDLAKAVQEAEEEKLGTAKEKEPEKQASLMTAEEEAELADMLADSD
ncbi:WD domain-containing protein [Massariosphaeria phaeospora]|uniref:WD domain-containing protein n=1 Tax=Massariosphaeria phaeospora TaxID=100035 RepID=A0A7C8ME58_9PLEO|nr:WD domain-containing protein [Massariosphaeria phaeospora]